MRNVFFVYGMLMLAALARCATQQPVVEYNLPNNLTEPQQNELRAKLDRGRQLYKPGCSGCHGIFSKGKDGVPNFTARQISLYKARHELHDSSNHAFAMKMPPEDLDAILNFLLLRKKPDTTGNVQAKKI
jgi:mono/diheme cytochrome c family protein